MTKTNLLTPRGGWDHVADLNLLSRYDDTINEQLDELAFLFKRCIGNPLLHALTERFDRLHHPSELVVVSHTRLKLAFLFCHSL